VHSIINACLSLSIEPCVWLIEYLPSFHIVIFSFNVSILQTEIDTHLHILHINLNTNYDSVASTSAALRAMHTIFPEPEGIGITAR
jgi:hypothetical protein